MGTWRSMATVPGSPAKVIGLLTEPDAIARWAPVPFEVLDLDAPRLAPGSCARVAGRVAGRSVEFDVNVVDASDERLVLRAEGPISLHVRYLLRPDAAGSDIDASVSVAGKGLFGRLLAQATEALLAAGALRLSLERLRRELELAPAA